MTWFAAHIVMSVKLKKGRQTSFPAWENVRLIQAKTAQQAIRLAEKIGRAEQGDDDGSFTWGGKPAEWLFRGVRKVTACALSGERPGDGDEITYNELNFAADEELRHFASGLPADVRHDDCFADEHTASKPAPSKRKPA